MIKEMPIIIVTTTIPTVLIKMSMTIVGTVTETIAKMNVGIIGVVPRTLGKTLGTLDHLLLLVGRTADRKRTPNILLRGTREGELGLGLRTETTKIPRTGRGRTLPGRLTPSLLLLLVGREAGVEADQRDLTDDEKKCLKIKFLFNQKKKSCLS